MVEGRHSRALASTDTHTGLLGTSLASVGARHWNLFNGLMRRIITEYGTALSVLVWTLVSM